MFKVPEDIIQEFPDLLNSDAPFTWDHGPDGMWRIVVYTDGSCLDPSSKLYRRAGRSLFCSDCPHNCGRPLTSVEPQNRFTA